MQNISDWPRISFGLEREASMGLGIQNISPWAGSGVKHEYAFKA